MRLLKLMPTLLLLCLAPTLLAQADCPAIVSAALEAVDSACSNTQRNQLCYGNIVLDATPREGITDFAFEQAGDIVGIADVQSLQLSTFNLTNEEWGVALMRVQANLPDTLPGQNVTMLMFGNVSIADSSEKIVEVPVTATSGVNVRLRPNTDAAVLLSLRSGQEVIANGRLFDTSWIRVQLDDSSLGWVSADFLNGDLNRLLPAEPGADAFGPMQAFSFTTGYGDAPCDEAPDSGILIQTPKGVGTITLRANDVHIELGSTVYLQAQSGDAMSVSVLEGHATLTAQGASQIVPAGTVSTIPLDSAGQAASAPTYPQPYAFQHLQHLPVDLAVFTPVEVEPAASDVAEAIDALTPSNATADTTTSGDTGQSSGDSTVQNDGLPRSGTWVWTETIVRADCAPGADPVGKQYTSNFELDFSDDYSSVTAESFFGTYTYPRISDNVYSIPDPAGFGSVTFVFTSATTMTITHLGNVSDPDGECSFKGTGPAVYQP